MFRTVAVLALVASASAFAPKAVGRSGRQAMKMSFESEVGAQPPLGFFDPLNLLKDADQARFDRLRTVEVKHGRISMLAILGHLTTTAGGRVPGMIAYTDDLKFADIPSGLAAFSKIPVWGTVQLFGFIGLLEFGFAQVKDGIEAGCEKQMDRAGWDASTKDSKRAIELNNGRAAMMGILALMVHEKLNNDPYIINTLLGSPVDFNAGF